MIAVNSLIGPFTESSNPQFPLLPREVGGGSSSASHVQLLPAHEKHLLSIYLLPYTSYTPESQEQTESIC